MNSKILDIDYTVGEVELSYKPQFKKLHKVASSEDAYKYLLPTYKKGTICYKVSDCSTTSCAFDLSVRCTPL